jgi:hypothetical protein
VNISSASRPDRRGTPFVVSEGVSEGRLVPEVHACCESWGLPCPAPSERTISKTDVEPIAKAAVKLGSLRVTETANRHGVKSRPAGRSARCRTG